jgi:hypothetical protein
VQLLVVTDFERNRYATVRSSKSEVTKTLKAIILYPCGDPFDDKFFEVRPAHRLFALNLSFVDDRDG